LFDSDLTREKIWTTLTHLLSEALVTWRDSWLNNFDLASLVLLSAHSRIQFQSYSCSLASSDDCCRLQTLTRGSSAIFFTFHHRGQFGSSTCSCSKNCSVSRRIVPQSSFWDLTTYIINSTCWKLWYCECDVSAEQWLSSAFSENATSRHAV